MVEPKYRFTYFPVRALGEPVRLLLSFGNIPFEDIRITKAEWPQYKDKMPMGQMPILEIGNKVYYQSRSISRYLGTELGLAGTNSLECLEIDIAMDDLNDFRQAMAAAFYDSDQATIERKYKTLIAETIPYFLKKLEARAAANKGHLALGKLTWVDFYFAGMADYLSDLARQDILAKNPNLKAVTENVFSLPAVKAWYATAPKSDH